jgi:hypothetical protein
MRASAQTLECAMPMSLRKMLHALLLKIMDVVVRFSAPLRHTAFVGNGSSRQLCEHIVRTGARRVLVITDKPLRDLGVVDRATAALREAGLDVAYYDGVLPDPTFDQVRAGAALARSHGSDALLAIGGGSSMDAAKVIAAAATSTDSPTDWVGMGKIKHQVLKLYAIPTTSGTGSEATIGAVISDSTTHEKSIIMAECLLPVAVALDADLILALPPHITAATGMDALTHGIEAYIGVWERGTRLEDARVAIKLIFDNLPTAYRDGANAGARNAMAMAAYYAGPRHQPGECRQCACHRPPARWQVRHTARTGERAGAAAYPRVLPRRGATTPRRAGDTDRRRHCGGGQCRPGAQVYPGSARPAHRGRHSQPHGSDQARGFRSHQPGGDQGGFWLSGAAVAGRRQCQDNPQCHRRLAAARRGVDSIGFAPIMDRAST